MLEDYSGYSWIEVKPYSFDANKSWEERYEALEKHHIAETKFLIEKVRELAVKLEEAEKTIRLDQCGFHGRY